MKNDRRPARSSSFFRRSLAAAGLCLALGTTFATTASPAFGTPTLRAESGGRTVSRFFIGDHLSVAITGAAPSTSYQLRLVDDDGAQVAVSEITTDAAGNAAPKRLWTYSGVVGCDLSSVPYPPLSRFQHFAEAEAALAGRTFEIEALDSDGVLAASLALPLLAPTRELRYFSDASGCLRYHFKDTETVYLALRHPNRTQATRRLYLTAPSSFAIGSNLADVRGFDGVQIWNLPATGNPVVVEVWNGAVTTLGSYAGIVRSEPTSFGSVLASDGIVGIAYGSPIMLDGVMITIDGCPTCTGP